MAVTKSWATQPAFLSTVTPPRARRGLVAMIGASLFIVVGLLLAYAGKAQGIGQERPVNLNAIASAEELLPLLESFPDRLERQRVADATFDFIQRRRPLPNVGALAPLRRTEKLPFGRLKPLVAVRTAEEYRRELLKNVAIYFGAFYFVALVWGF